MVLEEISTVDDTPDDLVFELHNEARWATHPYGYSILGTRDTVSSLGSPSSETCRPERTIPAGRGAAAGNVRHDDLLEILSRTGWSDLPRGNRVHTIAPPRSPPRVGAAPHVERAGAQTHIVFGSPTMRYSDPRRYAVVLIDTCSARG